MLSASSDNSSQFLIHFLIRSVLEGLWHLKVAMFFTYDHLCSKFALTDGYSARLR